MSLVESASYRQCNLWKNHIHFYPLDMKLPGHITSLIHEVRRGRDPILSQSLDPERQRQLHQLWLDGPEHEVQDYFFSNIFPAPSVRDSIQRDRGYQMNRDTVPDTGSDSKVSYPWPDMLYGYKHANAFTEAQLSSMGDIMFANARSLLYPFFYIEAEGDGSAGRGSLWVATNECLGGSASCVKITEHFNQQLRDQVCVPYLISRRSYTN